MAQSVSNRSQSLTSCAQPTSEHSQSRPKGTASKSLPNSSYPVNECDKQLGEDEEWSVGDMLVCHTISGTSIKGEVVANEPQANVLILEQPGDSAQSSKSHIVFINLQHVTKAEKSLTLCSKSTCGTSRLGSSINIMSALEEAKRRLKRKERQCLTYWLGNAPPEAVAAYTVLRKTYESTTWDGVNIGVLRGINVGKPYDETGVECADQRSSSIQAVEQIKKVLSQNRMKPP